MTHVEKLSALRSAMQANGIDAYVIPSSDPHISEYLPERYKCISWTSGFTGSAGTLAITQDFAGLWTDSRYFVQANEQLAATGFELVKLKAQGVAEYAQWLAEKLPAGAQVAFDGNLASVAVAQAIQIALEPKGIHVDGHVDLLETIWEGRPSLPTAAAYLLDVAAVGVSTVDKLAQIRSAMAAKGADAHFISSLDDLAWALNIRGQDVPCNPVVLGFLLLDATQNKLFINKEKLSSTDLTSLAAAGVLIAPYEDAFDAIKEVQAKRILLDPKKTCF